MRTQAGDHVRYIDFDSVEAEVVVMHPLANVRDGFPGFIGQDPSTGASRWGFDGQILAINGEEVD